MTKHIVVTWTQRHGFPAASPPNEAYPYGIALDLTAGRLPACSARLPYPASGVGSWTVRCERCGLTAVVTAAGRHDDPTRVKVACKPLEAA